MQHSFDPMSHSGRWSRIDEAQIVDFDDSSSFRDIGSVRRMKSIPRRMHPLPLDRQDVHWSLILDERLNYSSFRQCVHRVIP